MTSTDLSSLTTTGSSGARRRTGWALTALAAAFLAVDAVLHVVRPDAVVQSFTDLGYPVDLARPLGLLELVCLALYLLPRTAPLGAVLLTGYLGGAVSAHARLQDALLSTTLFPVYLGLALWAGLWLRDHRVHLLTTSPTRPAPLSST
ncbi:MAG: DoxX family protein [Mycobacteriaceae bacterium]